MGHHVDHLGSFTVEPPLNDELRTFIDGPLFEDPWQAANERGLPTPPDSFCVWWTKNGDGSTLRWHGIEKAYDGAAWLTWLIDVLFAPDGHEVTGSVHRFAEPEGGFVDCSRIDACGDTVTEHVFEVGQLAPDGPSLGEAIFLLTEAEDSDEDAQAELLRFLDATLLADEPGLASFLREITGFWPDPALVAAAIDAATDRRGETGADRGGVDDVDRLVELLRSMPPEEAAAFRSLADHIDDERLEPAIEADPRSGQWWQRWLQRGR